MRLISRELKRKLETYHPYAACGIVGALLVSKMAGVPGADKFFTVAYQTTRNDQVHHGKGYDDACLVFLMLNVITIIRFLHRAVVLEPIARKLRMSPGLTAKFIEAGWFGIYYLVATTWGYFIFRDDEWWYNATNFWKGYPQAVDHDMKVYYLTSLAFWLQSLLSFTFEPPRRDDVAMTLHHFLTVSLIVCSYLAGFVRVGAAILMEQNAADILFYHSKLFKYAKLELFSTIGWVSFVFVWFYTRHIIFGAVLYSLWTEVAEYIPYVWDHEREIYWTQNVHYGFFAALCLLQALMLFWFCMILKVAYKVVTGQGEMKDSTEYSDEEVEASKTGIPRKAKKPNNVGTDATTTTTPAKGGKKNKIA